MNALQQAEIILGDDADIFFETALGKYIIGRAQEESDEAAQKLKTVDPENAKEIKELQFIIQKAEAAPIWLHEAILAGRQTLESLQDTGEFEDA